MFGHQIGRYGQFTGLILLWAIFLVACTGQPTQVEPSATRTIRAEIAPSLPSTDTPEATLLVEPSKEPTATPTALPTATLEPTSTPEPTPTNTPEVLLQPGEVRYEFVDPATNEAIAVALPHEWVNTISQAETEAGQMYKQVPLAQARIEGEAGNRRFMVGKIALAFESDVGWKKNDAVYAISNHLGFEGITLAVDESLGTVSIETIDLKDPIWVRDRSSYVDGFGTLNVTFFTGITPIEASRSHLLVPYKEGVVFESASITIKFVFKDLSGTVSTFSAVSHYHIVDDNVLILVQDWDPPLGVEQMNVGIYWVSSGMLDQSRFTNLRVDDNLTRYLGGLMYLEEGSSPSNTVFNQGELNIPRARLDNMMEDISP